MTKTPISLLVALLLCVSVTNGCITFYRDYGPSGDSFVLCSSGNVPPEWNDQVSAIVVPAGWSATLFQDYDYSGNSLDILEGIWSAPDDWNDQLSSVIITQGCPVFYQDYNLSGESLVVCQSEDVPDEWNDQVSSIYVPEGWTLTIYEDYGFSGTTQDLIEGTWNAPAEWNDELSSVKITTGCPVFYQDYDLGGVSFVSCSSEDVSAAWNDQISSIIVPTGMKLTLYQDYGFSGASVEIDEGVWNAPEEWNDQISSFEIDSEEVCPILYRDYGWSGPSFRMCESGNVPDGWNDEVSSIWVPKGWKLSLYRDYNYSGPSNRVGGGKWKASSCWNDQLSSVRVTKRP